MGCLIIGLGHLVKSKIYLVHLGGQLGKLVLGLGIGLVELVVHLSGQLGIHLVHLGGQLGKLVLGLGVGLVYLGMLVLGLVKPFSQGLHENL